MADEPGSDGLLVDATAMPTLLFKMAFFCNFC